jgi:hypothetical protein
LRPQAGTSEDKDRADVIKHHRADDLARRATLGLEQCEPAGDAQREKRHAGKAAEWNACTKQIASQQQPDD